MVGFLSTQDWLLANVKADGEKKKVLVPNSEKKKKESCSQQRKNFLGAGNREKKVKVTGNGEFS